MEPRSYVAPIILRSTIRIYRDSTVGWYAWAWNRQAANGTVIGSCYPRTYTTKAACIDNLLAETGGHLTITYSARTPHGGMFEQGHLMRPDGVRIPVAVIP